MTKTVRIENADTSDYKVKVTIQDKNFDTGEWQNTCTINLDYPTAESNGLYITSTRRLIVEEDGVTDMISINKKYYEKLLKGKE
jgi:hypothetical protein